MKKLYSIICASALTLLTINANAAIVNIGIGLGGGNTFFPATQAANIGDVITWTMADSMVQHTVTSTSVPGGAAAFNSGTLSSFGQQFSYTITVAGTYQYHCIFHTGMNGTITVATGITDPTQSLVTTAYPTPFTSSLTFNYNGVDKISVFNVLGDMMKSVETDGSLGTIEMNFDEMPSGIYFYRTYKDGAIFETRKIVKSKK